MASSTPKDPIPLTVDHREVRYYHTRVVFGRMETFLELMTLWELLSYFVSFEVQMFGFILSNEFPVLSAAAAYTALDLISSRK